MNGIDLAYILSGIFLILSAVAYFGYRKTSLGLTLFGSAFLVLVARTIYIGGDYFLFTSNLAIAVVFIAKAFSTRTHTAKKK